MHLREGQEEVERLRSTLLPSGAKYDRENVQSSPAGDTLSDTLCEIMEIEAGLDRERNAAAHTVNRAVKLINSIDQPEYRRLLRLRYIDCKSWNQIATEMNYTERTIYRIHGSALKTADTCTRELNAPNENGILS